MPKPHRDDISIGKDKWITFHDVDGRQSLAVPLDGILAPVMPLLDLLETNCVAGCCGVDAYHFWPNEIVLAARQSEIAGLAELLETARQQIVATGAGIFVSQRMNNYFDKRTLLELLKHISYWARHADNECGQANQG